MIKGLFKKNLAKALTFGVLLGIFNYYVFENLNADQWFVFIFSFIQLSVLTAFIGWAYGKIKNTRLFKDMAVALAILTAILAWAYGGHPEIEFFYLFYAVITWFTLGGATYAISEAKVKKPNYVLAFDRFLYKNMEASIVSVILAVITLIVGAIGLGLLEVAGFNVPYKLIEFVATVAFTAVPFVALELVYDFKKPLSQQEDAFGIMSLISKIAGILIYILALYLALYIGILALGAFSQILETGNTTAIFLAITIVNTLALFFVTKADSFAKRPLWSSSLLIYETLILLVVALYAISVRIGQHGLTVNRELAISAVLIFIVAYIYYLMGAVKKDQKAIQMQVLKGNAMVGLIMVIYALINLTPLNLNTLEDYSQSYIEKKKAEASNGEMIKSAEEAGVPVQ